MSKIINLQKKKKKKKKFHEWHLRTKSLQKMHHRSIYDTDFFSIKKVSIFFLFTYENIYFGYSLFCFPPPLEGRNSSLFERTSFIKGLGVQEINH